MARYAEAVNCSESDVVALQQLASDDTNPQLALRASVILESIGGTQVKDVAAKCAVPPNFVINWKRRYSERGIQGLYNKPRGSSKDVYGSAFCSRLADKLKETPPEGCSRWTGALLAEALGVSVRVVWRYLRKINKATEIAEKSTDEPVKLDKACRSGRKGNTRGLAGAQDEPGYDEEINSEKSELLDLKFVAQYMRKDGSTVIKQEFVVEDAAPDFDDYNLSNMELFRQDFATVEDNLIKCSSTITSRVATEYMTGVSKKKQHCQGITSK